jgi:hypothetical protein
MRNQWTKSAAAATILIAVGGICGSSGGQPHLRMRSSRRSRPTAPFARCTCRTSRHRPPNLRTCGSNMTIAGEVHRLRVEEGQGKTFRIMVWANGELRWFSPVEGKFIVLHEPGVQEEMMRAREAWDPHFALESIHRLQQQGKVKIRTQEPKQDSEPITLEVTEIEVPESSPLERHAVRYVLSIDPQTKLLTQREVQWLVDGTISASGTTALQGIQRAD